MKYLGFFVTLVALVAAFAVGSFFEDVRIAKVCASDDHATIHVAGGTYYCFTEQQLVDVIRAAVAAYGQHSPGSGV